MNGTLTFQRKEFYDFRLLADSIAAIRSMALDVEMKMACVIGI
jgi:hypothetical protein